MARSKDITEAAAPVTARRRGRPPRALKEQQAAEADKQILIDVAAESAASVQPPAGEPEVKVKRPRGRPPKKRLEEAAQQASQEINAAPVVTADTAPASEERLDAQPAVEKAVEAELPAQEQSETKAETQISDQQPEVSPSAADAAEIQQEELKADTEVIPEARVSVKQNTDDTAERFTSEASSSEEPEKPVKDNAYVRRVLFDDDNDAMRDSSSGYSHRTSYSPRTRSRTYVPRLGDDGTYRSSDLRNVSSSAVPNETREERIVRELQEMDQRNGRSAETRVPPPPAVPVETREQRIVRELHEMDQRSGRSSEMRLSPPPAVPVETREQRIVRELHEMDQRSGRRAEMRITPSPAVPVETREQRIVRELQEMDQRSGRSRAVVQNNDDVDARGDGGSMRSAAAEAAISELVRDISEAVAMAAEDDMPDDVMELDSPQQDDLAEGASQRDSAPHPKPKYTYAYLSAQDISSLIEISREFAVEDAELLSRDDLIIAVLQAQAGSMNYRFGGGTLEILQEGFGFLRPKGMLPTDNDVYLSLAQIRRFGLRNGDVVWGLIRPPREQEHYEALLRVEAVNFSDPETARNRPMFSQLTPIFPDSRIKLESDGGDWATRLVDMFAPIGMGQRALIVSPPKAGKTTLLKRIARAISANSPDIILMALLIDERPEEVTDIARSIDGEVIASTFDRPADEHIRVANLALEKAKRLVEAKRDVVILLDSITRLARASNLTVPPSGRTLSGGLDPSGLYFPKRFFGAARNFEEGGSLTIIGTALTDTGSRMDDVIYEEFKGTGNMELHLSRKLAEQRVFPAIDITRSGTRREDLLIPEDELTRLWVLRKRITGVDEAGALNLILDKLRQTRDNREFLMSIKLV